MTRIDEIVVLNGGILAIIFTDTQSEQRDITLFQRHATAEDLDSLEVWQPKPTDETMTLSHRRNHDPKPRRNHQAVNTALGR